MAQCEHTSNSGERCSNQAVPGTPFCQTHRPRIRFKPVQAAPVAPPAPAASPPDWTAQPAPSGQPPGFPGLTVDERGIRVGAQGLIWLPAEPTPDDTLRATRLLSLLSEAVPLPGQVHLLRQSATGDSLVALTPEAARYPQRSTFYDTAAAAARLVAGRLYVGDGRCFIQYRDEAAPHGYDLPDFEAPSSEEVLLVASGGSRTLSPGDYTKISLATFCTAIAVQPGQAGPLPEQVYVLAPWALYQLLATYFRAHHLAYRLARLDRAGEVLLLFDLLPRLDAPAGRTIPRFVLDYLSRLPRVAVLEVAHDAPRLLRQWAHTYPLRLDHIAGAFEADDMLLLTAPPHANLHLSPAPTFFEGDRLVTVHRPAHATPNRVSASAEPADNLRLPLLLRSDSGPTPPIAALLLTRQEVGWLRQVLYRQPGPTFDTYTLCQGADWAVLLGNDQPIEGIPFGEPLRRLGDSELFVALRQRFVPELPWHLLREALAIESDVYTVITPDLRLDVPAADFRPLSKLLVAEPGRPRVRLQLQPVAELPALAWTAPYTRASLEQRLPSRPTESAPKSGWLDKMAQILSGQQEMSVPVETVPATADDLEAHIREQAETFEAAGDFLAAALCYDVLGDKQASARCYHQTLKQKS